MNELYVITTITDDLIIAQRANHSVVIAKCPRCLVIGYHDEHMPFATCFASVSRLASDLRDPEFARNL
jgi:hypothetical protein